jgi:predicted TIM-barrel fold metal-dependent hydrolase
MKARNWHIQMYTNLAMISAIKDLILASPLPVVIDHFGGAQAEKGVEQAGFADLLEVIRAGKAYVKISAAYRSSMQAPDYADVAPLAKALIAANADRIVWGTDWPHPHGGRPGYKPTDISPFFPIDDGRLQNQLLVWAPDAGVRKKILVDNAVRLYQF